MKQKKLAGKIVMVHPQLTTDPADNRGKIGVVKSVVNDCVAYVAFEDGALAAYNLDGLLTLSPKAVMLQGLQSNIMSGNDLDTYIKVYGLTKQEKFREALKMAVDNETTAFYCVTDCLQWLDMKAQISQRDNKQAVKKSGKRKGLR